MNTRNIARGALSTMAGALVVAAAAGAVTSGGVAHAATHAAPATKGALVAGAQRPTFGHVLVNGRGLALYYWDKEKTGAVKCAGACAKVWPPLLIPAGAAAPKHVASVMGTFGVAMRPDGAHQLTFNHHPLYTFQGDKTPSQILCDGVDGWHVYRLTGR